MDWRQIGIAEVEAYLLVFARVATVFGFVPIFGMARIPPLLRVGAAGVTALLLFPVIEWDRTALPLAGHQLAWGLMQQVFVGFTLALSSWAIFIAVQTAGQAIDLTMGLGIVNIIDPLTSQQESILGQFLYLLALLLYFAVDGHLWLLKSFGDSFQAVPLLAIHTPAALATAVTSQLGFLFAAAVKLAGPALAVLVLTNLVLGLLSRTLPQMNVFIVGLPLSIGVGLAAVAGGMFLFVSMLTSLFGRIPGDLELLLRLMGGR